MKALTVPTVTIIDTKSMEHAAEILSQANKYLDAITAEELKVTKPLNEALTQERLRFKPFKDKAERVIANIRAQMSAYQTAEKKRVDAETAKIAARIGDGKGKIKMETAVRKLEAVVTPEEAVVTHSGLVKFRTRVFLDIVDISLIPREYLIPDEKRITEALKAGTVVPGATLNEEQVPVNYR